MLLSKCVLCNIKNLKFIKGQEASELLSKVRIKTQLSKITLLGDFCFRGYKTKEIINKFF